MSNHQPLSTTQERAAGCVSGVAAAGTVVAVDLLVVHPLAAWPSPARVEGFFEVAACLVLFGGTMAGLVGGRAAVWWRDRAFPRRSAWAAVLLGGYLLGALAGIAAAAALR